MSKNILIFILMYNRHKLLDLIIGKTNIELLVLQYLYNN
jgi:hypothetical protein